MVINARQRKWKRCHDRKGIETSSLGGKTILKEDQTGEFGPERGPNKIVVIGRKAHNSKIITFAIAVIVVVY
jgi:hypothetical protein